jgi:cell division protein FtsB
VWLNIALVSIAVACLLYYVIAANGLAAQAWRSTDAQDRLATLLDERNSLVAQQSALEDRSVLSALATNAGMIPAGAVVYLVQNQPVAAR